MINLNDIDFSGARLYSWTPEVKNKYNDSLPAGWITHVSLKLEAPVPAYLLDKLSVLAHNLHLQLKCPIKCRCGMVDNVYFIDLSHPHYAKPHSHSLMSPSLVASKHLQLCLSEFDLPFVDFIFAETYHKFVDSI